MADFSNIGEGVYWKGADGNIYMKASGLDGVQKWVAPLKLPQDLGLTEIADPLGGAPPVNRTGDSGGGTAPVLNTAAINATQSSINSVDTDERVGEENVQRGFDTLIGQYDRETGRTTEDFNTQSNTNKTNLQKNRQNALVGAAQGRRGLRGTLAAMGALSGTGIDLADRAVTTEANQDLGQATETAAANTGKLTTAFDRYKEEDAVRREEARGAAEDQRAANRGSAASKRQQFYQKMAELYAEGGNNAAAAEWLAKTEPLNEVIAQNRRVTPRAFTPKAAAFTPGDLESYLAGAGDMTVKVQDGGMGGTLNPTSILAGRGRRKSREEEELAVA